jgi:hypothetical protein
MKYLLILSAVMLMGCSTANEGAGGSKISSVINNYSYCPTPTGAVTIHGVTIVTTGATTETPTNTTTPTTTLTIPPPAIP